jgi:hypothetical protein
MVLLAMRYLEFVLTIAASLALSAGQLFPGSGISSPTLWFAQAATGPEVRRCHNGNHFWARPCVN